MKLRSQLARVALVSFSLAVLLAVLAPVLPLRDPNATELGRRLLPPFSAGHPFGTDQLGRDLGARLVYGMRASLAVAFAGVVMAGSVGSALGVLAAVLGRFADGLIMRVIDVLMAFPYLLLALAVVAALGPGLGHATLAIAIVNIPFFARTARGAALGVMAEDFVLAATAAGASRARVVFRHVMPSIAPPLSVAATTTLGWMLLETAGLSFLGLGAQPPLADLGGMLGQGRHLAATAPHVMLLPGAVIFLLAMSVNVLGDAWVEALDPKRRSTPERSAREEPEEATAGDPVDADALLRVDALRVEFETLDGRVAAVNGVGFCIRERERVGLVGESGSGKTATALAVLDLLPDNAFVRAGRLVHRGRDLVALDVEARRALLGCELALVPQDPQTSLHPLMTIGEQLEEAILRHQALSPSEARRHAVELLTELRVADPERRLDARPHELSGGMRQRVSIAMALANDPKLVVADEPTTALDPTTRAAVLDVLESLCERRGTALLYITHDLGAVAEICSRVLVMHEGRVVERGDTETLFRAPQHPYTQRLLAAARFETLSERSRAEPPEHVSSRS